VRLTIRRRAGRIASRHLYSSKGTILPGQTAVAGPDSPSVRPAQ